VGFVGRHHWRKMEKEVETVRSMAAAELTFVHWPGGRENPCFRRIALLGPETTAGMEHTELSWSFLDGVHPGEFDYYTRCFHECGNQCCKHGGPPADSNSTSMLADLDRPVCNWSQNDTASYKDGKDGHQINISEIAGWFRQIESLTPQRQRVFVTTSHGYQHSPHDMSASRTYDRRKNACTAAEAEYVIDVPGAAAASHLRLRKTKANIIKI
ncbi:MAG: hypothetical protein Q9228_007042, partial [Teloschistes exilis]